MAATDPILPDSPRFPIRPPRPLWIGLAAVVLVVVAIGLQLALPIYRRQVAIREIEQVGGYVTMRPRGWEWLRNRVGDERMKLFDDVDEIHLEDSQATDATLVRLSWLPSVEVLNLDQAKVTDLGLAHLRGLTSLQAIALNGTQTTDAGLANLKMMSSLRELGLEAAQVTDAGLAHLKELTRLRLHLLGGTQVTDDGVAELRCVYVS